MLKEAFNIMREAIMKEFVPEHGWIEARVITIMDAFAPGIGFITGATDRERHSVTGV